MMQRREFVGYVLERGFVLAAGGAACSTAGCGAFIHPERCGQLHSSQIDWKIVALDGLGLLLFFVPGIIAFIVDFWTGAIYLPIYEAYPGYGACELPPVSPALPPPPPYSAVYRPVIAGPQAALPCAATRPETGLKRLAIPREQLLPERIEQIVSQHLGRPVSLNDRTRPSELASLDQFDEQANRHRSDPDFGFGIRSFFERLMGA
jgi:hypothetical protein